jgi:ribosomal protein S18 acetylase RimI-like enzyme
VTIVELRMDHADALGDFFAALPTGDLTLIREEVTDRDQVRRTVKTLQHCWLALDDKNAIAGYVAVEQLPGWSDHVGEIRLVVHPDHRRSGLGRTLARHALLRSVEAGLTKLIVELVADQEHALGMFAALGFTGEALLRDHIRDNDGRVRDLVVLAHYVGDTWSAMASTGIDDALGR